MSRNGSGVYTLPATNPVVPGSTIATVWANGTMTDIAAALTASVAADGQTPMTGNLNANSNKIVGLVAGTIAGNSVEFAQFSTPTFTGDVTCSSTGYIQIPTGTTAQRPATAAAGEIRFNTSTNVYEGYVTGLAGVTISGISFVSTTATLTTASAHGLSTGNYVTVSGASPSQYNGTYIITVTGSTTFTYVMATTPATNATVVGSYTANLWVSLGNVPAGSNTQVQYNNSGYLGASSALTFNGTTLATTTLSSTNLSDGTNSTLTTNAIKGSAKAWVNFNGTSTITIRDSFNVSSVTRNAAGDYTINFTTAMPNANYSVSVSCMLNASPTANSAFPIVYGNATYTDTYKTNSIRIATVDYVSIPKDVLAANVTIFSS